jgi:hypothetical protein
MIYLTPNRMRTLCILADEKDHFPKDLADALNMQFPNFSTDVLKPLIKDNFCCYGERIKTRKPGRPPRPIIIKSYTSVGQFLVELVSHTIELLNAAMQTSAYGVHASKHSNRVVKVHGYIYNFPDNEIKNLENNLQSLSEWSKKREQANPSWRNDDGVGGVDCTLAAGRKSLDRAKNRFSESKHIVLAQLNKPIEIIIGGNPQ